MNDNEFDLEPRFPIFSKVEDDGDFALVVGHIFGLAYERCCLQGPARPWDAQFPGWQHRLVAYVALRVPRKPLVIEQLATQMPDATPEQIEAEFAKIPETRIIAMPEEAMKAAAPVVL